jgi:GWxTD domain-containing protein
LKRTLFAFLQGSLPQAVSVGLFCLLLPAGAVAQEEKRTEPSGEGREDEPRAEAEAEPQPEGREATVREVEGEGPTAEASEAAAEAAGRREKVSFDVVRLYGVEGKTLVEIYSRIPTSVLTFSEQDGRWTSALEFKLSVQRGDSVVLRDAWSRTKTVSDRRMLQSDRVFFIETHAFLVPPGRYELTGTVTDAGGKELGTLRQTLEAPAQNPPVSDLLLASRISPDTTAVGEGYDPVRKNRLVLNPNPGRVYSSSTSPLVFFYYEFDNRQTEPLPLVRTLRFLPVGSREPAKVVRAPKTYQPGWTVDFGAVNVSGLREGSYTLELLWEAPAGAELPVPYRGLVRSKEFVFTRERITGRMTASAPGPEGAAVGESGDGRQPTVDYYAGYSEAQLDSVFEMMDVFFRSSERSVYRGLTPEAKKTFLNRYWDRQDPTPGTRENAYREEVDARLKYIQDNFRSPTQAGYETPRGRIWLKYGRPDRRVERVLETGFSAPYEIWIFYDTGYKYVFLDEFRNRRYILLTSTDPEEQGRPDWQQRLPTEAVQEILRE